MTVLDRITKGKHQRHNLNWLVGAVGWKEFEGTVSLGICQRSKRIAKITNTISTIMIVNDIYEIHGLCEERHRCLAFDCPLNMTCYESFIHAFPSYDWLTRERYENLCKRVEYWQEAFAENIAQIAEEGFRTIRTFDEPALVYSQGVSA